MPEDGVLYSGVPEYGDSLAWGVMIQEKKKKADAAQINKTKEYFFTGIPLTKDYNPHCEYIGIYL